ncbi:MAG: hypothetical protein ACREOZ_00940 [Gloeomargaritales cyanobacterium]
MTFFGRSPIPIISDFDPDDTEKISFKKTNANGLEKKVKLPTFNKGAGATEELLYFSHRFREATTLLEWEIPEDLYHQFSCLLGSVAKENWEALLAEDADNARDTIEQFWNDITTFKQGYLSQDALENHRRYLLTVKKPKSLTVAQFSHRLKFMNTLTMEFPNAERRHQFTNDEFKNFFHEAMPNAWKIRFANSNSRVRNLAYPELTHYFQIQEEQSPDETKKSQHQKDDNNYNRSNRGRRNKHKKSQNKPDDEKAKKKKGQESENRITNNSPCPIHPNGRHKWGECNSNKYGFDSNNNNNSNKKQQSTKEKAKGKKTHESHANEVDSSDEEMMCFECQPGKI